MTGSTGFVGSHLIRRLVAGNFEVSALVRTGSKIAQLASVAHKLRVIESDGSTQAIVNCFANTKPDIVFHLASRFVAEHRTEDVCDLVDSNVRFGAQVLEGMAISGTRRLVLAGTSWQHFHSDGYRPACLYAATKQAFEAVLDFYIDAREFRAVTLKLFDTYGPDDPRPKLFRLLERAAEQRSPLEMSGGEQLMDLVYIDDVVDAFVLAADRLLSNKSGPREEYPVSSGRRISLREVVEKYLKAMGADVNVRWGARPYREREVMVPWNKSIGLPGWAPKVRLEDGLQLIRNHRLAVAVTS